MIIYIYRYKNDKEKRKNLKGTKKIVKKIIESTKEFSLSKKVSIMLNKKYVRIEHW